MAEFRHCGKLPLDSTGIADGQTKAEIVQSVILIRKDDQLAVTGMTVQQAPSDSRSAAAAWNADGRCRVHGSCDPAGRPWFAVNDYGVIGCIIDWDGGEPVSDTPLSLLSLGVLTEVLSGLLARREFRGTTLFLADRFTGYTLRWGNDGQVTTTTNPGRTILVVGECGSYPGADLNECADAFAVWVASGSPMDGPLPTFVLDKASQAKSNAGITSAVAQCAADFRRHQADFRTWDDDVLDINPSAEFTVPLLRRT